LVTWRGWRNVSATMAALWRPPDLRGAELHFGRRLF
jgi:hypothetical protein